MDTKEAKEFSTDAIYGISEMLAIINDQTQEIEYLKDKLVDNVTNTKEQITYLEGQIEDLTESSLSECPTEDIAFDGEYDFYE